MKSRNSLTVENLTVSYPNSKEPALKKVTLNVEAPYVALRLQQVGPLNLGVKFLVVQPSLSALIGGKSVWFPKAVTSFHILTCFKI